MARIFAAGSTGFVGSNVFCKALLAVRRLEKFQKPCPEDFNCVSKVLFQDPFLLVSTAFILLGFIDRIPPPWVLIGVAPLIIVYSWSPDVLLVIRSTRKVEK